MLNSKTKTILGISLCLLIIITMSFQDILTGILGIALFFYSTSFALNLNDYVNKKQNEQKQP
jgi:hypothetical protein